MNDMRKNTTHIEYNQISVRLLISRLRINLTPGPVCYQPTAKVNNAAWSAESTPELANRDENMYTQTQILSEQLSYSFSATPY